MPVNSHRTHNRVVSRQKKSKEEKILQDHGKFRGFYFELGKIDISEGKLDHYSAIYLIPVKVKKSTVTSTAFFLEKEVEFL